MNLFKKVINVGVYLALLLLLVGSWGAIILTVIALFDAVRTYGLGVANILLDAKLGYAGLLSFGLSSFALLLASASTARVRPIGKFVGLFRVTFFVSISFLLPTIFAILMFLFSSN